MGARMEKVIVETKNREEFVDITRILVERVAALGWENGAVMLFCPHTTCGLTINEGADPDVRADMLRFFREAAPRQHGWKHAEGNSDAHIKASLLGASQLIPLEGGRLCLGTWQSVYLFEGDGPRRRNVWLTLLG